MLGLYDWQSERSSPPAPSAVAPVASTSLFGKGAVAEADADEDDADVEDEETIEDGTYSADVEYENPETGYFGTYTLDVEITDGEVTQIDFPNGGYPTSYRLSNTELDEEGCADVEDDESRSYHVCIIH